MAELENEWREQGFSPNQIHEITEGIEAGLDVSVYAKKEYYSMQMRQIRLGMLDGLPVELYARPKYDWFQMEEIRLGLENKIDIGKYANPKLSYDKMRQIRKGLMADIDLSQYSDMDAGVLRELRKAIIGKVDIVKYINEGYGAEQLRQIRYALKKDLNIEPYIRKEYRGAAVAQIIMGLESGIKVSIYAQMKYDWRQMREIRLGLEMREDVSLYADPFFDWRQMREVRLGLESGVDVKQYCTLMYTPDEMRKIRLALENGGPVYPEEADLGAEESAADSNLEEFSDFIISVSGDEMYAYFVLNEGKKTTRSEVMNALKKKGISYGISEEAIEKIVEGTEVPVQVAKGTEPTVGKAGFYEYFFRTEEKWQPTFLEDGSVDYQNSQWFQTVSAGDRIAVYHEATRGRDGYTVNGKCIQGKKGEELSMISGKGFMILPDKKTYLAAIDGRIEMRNGRIEISHMLVLNDLTVATGKVDFNGSVYVRGNVGGGVHIKAEEDVILDGFVEGAYIETEGSVILRKGVNGGGIGVIRAKKEVKGGFFESVTIYAGGNIQGNYCMNSNLYSEGRVDINGSKDSNGVLMGGLICAVGGLTAYQIGNRTKLLTTLKIGFNEMMQKRLREMEEKLKTIEMELGIFQNAHADFCKRYPVEVRNTMDMFLKIENAIYTKEKEQEYVEGKKAELEEIREKTENVKVQVDGTLYEGSIIEINGIRWKATDMKRVVLKKSEGKIMRYINR